MLYTTNLEETKTRLAALSKRASKLGLEAPTLSVIDSWREYWDEGAEQWVKGRCGALIRTVWACELQGPTVIKMAGWRFLARLEKVGDSTLVQSVAGCEVPEAYRHADASVCEHCGAKRARKASYVVQHEDGRLMQVGKSCLKDFLGHHAVSVMAHMRFLKDSEACFGMIAPKMWDLRYFVAATLQVVRAHGFVGRTRAREEFLHATADRVVDLLESAHKGVTDADLAQADVIIAWVRSLMPTSDYEHNIQVIATECGAVSAREAGYAASIPSAYDRAHAKARAEKTPVVSHHVGAIKERRVFNVTFDHLVTVEGYYGTRFIHSFVDASGARVVWFSSKPLDAELGDEVAIKATVMKHGEYKGTKQTVVSRVVLA